MNEHYRDFRAFATGHDAGYDPLEDRLRENIRSTIEAVFEEELAQFLGRCRYGREDALRQGYRNGHRERQ